LNEPLGPLKNCIIINKDVEQLFRQGLETVNSANLSAKAGSGIGDPIHASEFRPVKSDALARVGSPNDGGYVVPLDAIKAAHALVSFGLSHDWTFERDFKRLNKDAIIHCYDHTVSLRTAFQFSIGQLLRFVLLFRARSLRMIFTWIDYEVFFRSEATHFRQKISSDNQDNGATIDDVFGRLPAGCPVFLKMDIEGSEYLVLDDLLRHSANIVAMAIEFHDVEIRPELFNSIVEKIKRDFYIVHIHGNNMGGLTPYNFPNAPEITFLHKRFFNPVPSPSTSKYPISGLDRPNNPRLPEFKFDF
jgi:hypothetical protein